jgi:hypothetical protein
MQTVFVLFCFLVELKFFRLSSAIWIWVWQSVTALLRLIQMPKVINSRFEQTKKRTKIK